MSEQISERLETWRQEYADDPGEVYAEVVRDGIVFTWRGGPITLIDERDIHRWLTWRLDGRLPWRITSGPVDPDELATYYRRGELLEWHEL